jgi:formylglycine-generating enzyme
VVKWSNARSEKEGLTPVYRNADGTVFKTGTSVPTANWSANGYRLPTEAEWEKAARGGLSGKRFPWGDTISHSQANYYSLSGYSYDVSPTRGYHPTYNDGTTPRTSPVGSFEPNGYGLYDMAGNVYEWCWDWHSRGYYSSSPGSDPRGPTSGSHRVIRGGYWGYGADRCRTASRYYNVPGLNYNNYLGIRCARSSVP